MGIQVGSWSSVMNACDDESGNKKLTKLSVLGANRFIFQWNALGDRVCAYYLIQIMSKQSEPELLPGCWLIPIIFFNVLLFAAAWSGFD